MRILTKIIVLTLVFVHASFSAEHPVLIYMTFNYAHPPSSNDDTQLVSEALTKDQTRLLAFSTIEKFYREQEANPQEIEPETAKNLELYTGANLLSIITRASTYLGEASLGVMLAQPQINIEDLHRRQEILKVILSHKTLFQDLSNALDAIKKIENHLLIFWQEQSLAQEPFKQWYVDDIFPRAKAINKSPRWLEMFRRTEDIATLFLIPMGFLYINYLYRTNTIQRLQDSFHTFATQDLSREEMITTLQDIGFGGSQVLNAFVYIPYATYEVLKYFRSSRHALHYLHNKLQYFALALDSIKKMRNTLLKYKHELSKFHEGQAIIKLFACNAPNEIKKVLSLLDEPTFHRPFSYVFSNFGQILAANKQVESTKTLFIPALAALGKLDAYISIARLYKEFEQKQITYSFAHYEQLSKPHLALVNFWNPLIPPNKVVVNSFELGNNHSRNVILTGQNTSGKSTVLKGIALCILLAQTLTIVPATSMRLTPFHTLNTYMNIVDNTKEGLSLFAAEVAQAKHLLDQISSQPSTQKSFTIIDEAFKGTGGEAEELSYWYANTLLPYENNMCINATHYPKLTRLEAETNGAYRNYKVEVKKDPNGKLIRPYKLEPGFTLYNIAQDILIEQGLMPARQ